ncbi:hypothetical protein ACVWW2_002854 [Bradyrhizobium sp. LM4.3]
MPQAFEVGRPGLKSGGASLDTKSLNPTSNDFKRIEGRKHWRPSLIVFQNDLGGFFQVVGPRVGCLRMHRAGGCDEQEGSQRSTSTRSGADVSQRDIKSQAQNRHF